MKDLLKDLWIKTRIRGCLVPRIPDDWLDGVLVLYQNPAMNDQHITIYYY